MISLIVLLAISLSCATAQIPTNIFSPVRIPDFVYPPNPLVNRKNKNLNEACSDRAECKPAFSICLNKICTCPPGFSASNGICMTTTYSCPLGEPLRLNGIIRSCTRKQVQTLSNQFLPSDFQFIDSCGDGYMCVAQSQDSAIFPISITGHCCPKPKSSCPMGIPTNQKCSVNFVYMPNGMPMPDPTICNSTTHYCLANTFNGVDAEAVCCPKACLENEIYANGKCYTQIELGEKCEIDAQCSMGQCGPQGTCICRKGELKEPYANYCSRPYCGMNDGFTNMYSYDIQNANPMTNPMGDWIQCGSSANQCGTSGFCHAKYAICCPKPKLRCPQPYVPTPFDFANPFHQPTEPPILPESSRCIPVPNKSGCPTNQTCVYQYSHLTNAGTLEISGVCCPNQNKLPPNVQPIAAGQTVNGLQIGSMQNGPNRQNGSNVWQNIQGG